MRFTTWFDFIPRVKLYYHTPQILLCWWPDGPRDYLQVRAYVRDTRTGVPIWSPPVPYVLETPQYVLQSPHPAFYALLTIRGHVMTFLAHELDEVISLDGVKVFSPHPERRGL